MVFNQVCVCVCMCVCFSVCVCVSQCVSVCVPQDVAALESQPLLGFFLREEKYGPFQKLQFKLYHKNTLFYIFKADDIPTAQR